MLYLEHQNIMKKLSMGLAALMMVAPTPFMLNAIAAEPIIIILILVLSSWVFLEFYIGLSRPCEGKAPFHPLIIISRGIWLLFVIYTWLDFNNDWTRVYFPLWYYSLLIVICVFALLMRLWAFNHLGKSFSYDVKRPVDGNLITTGPYRIIRHPAYMAICILGSLPGQIMGSVPGFIGMLATTIIVVIYRIDAEEKMLERAFGGQFIDYQSHTFRLFPFIY